jgi:hypothetical protein
LPQVEFSLHIGARLNDRLSNNLIEHICYLLMLSCYLFFHIC